MTLYHDQDISRHILVRNEPGFATPLSCSANAQSLPLADGVVHQAGVPAHDVASRRLYLARLMRQVAMEKLPERPFTDKTNPGAVFLGKIGQFVISGNLAYVALVKMTDRK